jgi:RNA 3'-terminal phosphate cyclase (ATP)
MVEIDGSFGEGGGQIVRTALSLSALLGVPFRLVNIRRKRSKPGLRAQHVAAVRAVKEISDAAVEGAEIDSRTLEFRPRGRKGGTFRFDIGTAGATPLVLQALLPPLLFSSTPSRVVLTGGTHVPISPPFHFIERIFLPFLDRLGARVGARLARYGFYPGGGGEIEAEIEPCRAISPVTMTADKGGLSVTGISVVANLPLSIAERQRSAVLMELGREGIEAEVELKGLEAPGPGTFVFLQAEGPGCRAGFSSIGVRGKRAEAVGAEAARELLEYCRRPGCFDPRLADQIVLYLALARGASVFATTDITPHLITNLAVIKAFAGIEYDVDSEVGRPGRVAVRPRTEPVVTDH